ncbi:MAG: adenosylcobalamin-dependent ribonucleoside-diphosphate reductase, partial [Candidatus Roizmanbacteria bacterium]|nr:adenosylcobalamin-dependent ribonucleoside-diphosphate reductase [Candidatus Roizmanbacteria bacterium]
EPKDKKRKIEQEFYKAMDDFKYVPGGRILAGAGTGYDVTFYNCFVIPSPKDSRGGILETLKQMIEIMAHGGGVGINLSSLRPRGARVEKVNGFSSGPCNWAELFSLATKDIIQQGGSRRGALMLMIWDWHPDVEEFITVKQDLSRINGANLSVCVSDSFMAAVKSDGDWDLVFPDVHDPEYDDLWDGDMVAWKKLGKKVIVKKTIKARYLWDLITQAAWASAEPGVVFMERYNKWHNNWYWNRINCVNPCGEEGLPPYGVCNLGSINLAAFVRQSDGFRTPGVFDYESLKKTVRTAVRFQDNVIDEDTYIFDGIRKMQLEGERRIGIGTMGLGDTLIKMHLRYGSPESLKMIDRIYKLIRDEAYDASIQLARERGAFGKFDKELYPQGRFIKALPKTLQDKIRKYGIRNSVILMQAPTGSTSLMVGVTSGIEPIYEFEFIRRDRLGEHVIRHPLYEAWLKDMSLTNGHVKEAKKPDFFVTANDLSPEDHVKVQAAIQRYVDASISKTVNAPNSHTVEDVKKVYTLAYELGLKGIAYMRDGSRPGVLTRKEEKKPEPVEVKQPAYDIRPRGGVMHGSTYTIDTPVGTAFITINMDEDSNPFEVFINIGKAGSDVAAMAEGMGRIITLVLRMNSHLTGRQRLEYIIEQLDSIGGARSLGFGDAKIRSLPDAIAKTLIRHFAANMPNPLAKHEEAQGQVASTEVMQQPQLISTKEAKTSFDICPHCGDMAFAYEEGCKKCYSCGHSECG